MYILELSVLVVCSLQSFRSWLHVRDDRVLNNGCTCVYDGIITGDYRYMIELPMVVIRI
jgi:hypothetical protein